MNLTGNFIFFSSAVIQKILIKILFIELFSIGNYFINRINRPNLFKVSHINHVLFAYLIGVEHT